MREVTQPLELCTNNISFTKYRKVSGVAGAVLQTDMSFIRV